MPRYDYACVLCGHVSEEVHSIHLDRLTECPKCHQDGYVKQVVPITTDLREFHTPIEMYSVACNSIEEIRQIQNNCPGVHISDDPRDEMYGVPVVKNRKEKLTVLKTVGYIEQN